jgi:hypothetical protein
MDITTYFPLPFRPASFAVARDVKNAIGDFYGMFGRTYVYNKTGRSTIATSSSAASGPLLYRKAIHPIIYIL